jgi:hypothetical protein
VGFLSVPVAGLQQLGRRFFMRVRLAFACALSGAIGLGFAPYALFEALRLQYGVVDASGGVGAIYLILAGILYLCDRRAGPTPVANAPSGPRPGLAGNVEAFKAAAQASDAPQAVALAMSIELVKQMTPLQLTMIAAISGFAAGRKL